MRLKFNLDSRDAQITCAPSSRLFQGDVLEKQSSISGFNSSDSRIFGLNVLANHCLASKRGIARALSFGKMIITLASSCLRQPQSNNSASSLAFFRKASLALSTLNRRQRTRSKSSISPRGHFGSTHQMRHAETEAKIGAGDAIGLYDTTSEIQNQIQYFDVIEIPFPFI